MTSPLDYVECVAIEQQFEGGYVFTPCATRRFHLQSPEEAKAQLEAGVLRVVVAPAAAVQFGCPSDLAARPLPDVGNQPNGYYKVPADE